ncbi:MAG: VanZ family protein [Actinomycetota bacterium]
MIGPTLPVAGAFIAVLLIAVLGATRRWKAWRTFLACITVGYGAAVVSVTLFPIPVQSSILPWERAFGLHNNFVPLVGLGEMLSSQPLEISMRQIAGNTLMFVPLGLLVPLLKPDVRLGQVFVVAVLASTAIEAAQFSISLILQFGYKITDVDDVLLNTLGALIGYGVVRADRALRGMSPRRPLPRADVVAETSS